jgi:hypothetical protein
MKYQIEQCGDQFFPQFKNALGFWRHFTFSNGYYKELVACSSKAEAESYLAEKERQQQEKDRQPKVKSVTKIIHPYP